MQRLPAALINKPTALWPPLTRTRKNVGSCDPVKTDMAGLPLAFGLIFEWRGDEQNRIHR